MAFVSLFLTFRLGSFTLSCVCAGRIWHLDCHWRYFNLHLVCVYIHNGLSSSWWV